MRALVTGGAGFLGSGIVEALLRRGDEVVVLDHRIKGKCLSNEVLNRIDPIEADICDASVVRDAASAVSAIFHCAALVGVAAYSGQPARMMDVEQLGLKNVCDAALFNNNACVVYASSSAVYGGAGGGHGLDENMVVAPTSIYGMAKRFNEMYLAAEHAERGLKSVAMRIFNMYGPRQDDRLVIPRFIQSALRNEKLTIFGDGTQTRDFVYIDDVVRVALACADNALAHEIVNVCSGIENSIGDLAAFIIQLSGSRSTILFDDRPAERAMFEVQRCFGSRETLERLVGKFTPCSLEEGLVETIAAARANIHNVPSATVPQ